MCGGHFWAGLHLGKQVGSALADTLPHVQDGFIPLPSHKGSGMTEASGCRATTPCWTLCSSNEPKQHWQTQHCLQQWESPHHGITLSAFVSVSHSHFCYVRAKRIHLSVPERAAASSNPSKWGGSGEHTGSLAGIIKLFLLYLERLLVSETTPSAGELSKETNSSKWGFLPSYPLPRQGGVAGVSRSFLVPRAPRGCWEPLTLPACCRGSLCLHPLHWRGARPKCTPEHAGGTTTVPCNEGTVIPRCLAVRWCSHALLWDPEVKSQGRCHRRRVGRWPRRGGPCRGHMVADEAALHGVL